MRTICLLLLTAAISVGLAVAGEVAVEPNPALVAVNGTVQFTASADTSIGSLDWQVVPPGLGSIDRNGKFTAAGKPGQGIVRATASAGQTKLVGHALVKVLPRGAARLVVAVEPLRAYIALGSTATFSVNVSDLSGTLIDNPEVAWKVLPSDLGSIDAAGVFTAKQRGLGRIVAVARKDRGRGLGQAGISVGLSPKPAKLQVSIDPQRIRLQPGKTIDVSVRVADLQGNPVPAKIEYQLNPPGLGRVSPSGAITASDKPGIGILLVRTESDNGRGTARAFVTVSKEVQRYRVQLRPKQAVVAPGQSPEFQVQAFDASGNQVQPPYWVWKVIPEKLGTVTPQGLFTAGQASLQGKLVAQLPPEFGTGQDFASVRIRPGLPNQVKVSPAKAVLKPGQAQQFTATVTSPQGQAVENLRITWRTFPEGLGTITPDGLFTAGQTPKLGTVVALVPPEQGGGRGYAVVGVSSYTVLILGPRPTQLQSGQVYQFQAEIKDAAGNPVSGITWEWSASSLYPSFGRIDPGTGTFTAGRPLAAQVEGNVFAKAKLGAQVVGANGIHVIVQRK